MNMNLLRKETKMISTNEEIVELIESEFESPIIKRDSFDNRVVVKFKGSTDYCEFCFRKMDSNNLYCADFFRGHNCLSYGVRRFSGNSGTGFMVVADEDDKSQDIITFITDYLKNAKRKEKKVKYEQMSIFDFVY